MNSNGKKFDSIDALVDDIECNYKYSEVGNRYDGKYRVKEIDTGTTDAILKKLEGFLKKRDVKIIFLVAEEING